jgi:hypothetical protein
MDEQTDPWEDPMIQRYLDSIERKQRRREKEKREAENQKWDQIRRYVNHLEKSDSSDDFPSIRLPARWGRLAERTIVLN